MLIEYLPEFLQNIEEFKKLFNAEEFFIYKLKDEINKAFSDQYILESGEKGIARYEKIMNVKKGRKDIEQRRRALYIKITDKLPYTLISLSRQLAIICGKDNFLLFVKHNDYLIYVRLLNIDDTALSEVKEILDKMIPANMIISIIFKNIHRFFKPLKHSEMKMFSHYKLRNDLAERGFLNG